MVTLGVPCLCMLVRLVHGSIRFFRCTRFHSNSPYCRSLSIILATLPFSSSSFSIIRSLNLSFSLFLWCARSYPFLGLVLTLLSLSLLSRCSITLNAYRVSTIKNFISFSPFLFRVRRENLSREEKKNTQDLFQPINVQMIQESE